MRVFIDLDEVTSIAKSATLRGLKLFIRQKTSNMGAPIRRSTRGTSLVLHDRPGSAVSHAALRLMFVLAALTPAPFSASAGQSSALCAAAKQPVEAERLLAAAVAAAFDKATFSSASEDCAYPLKLLQYSAADVLIVQAGEPGKACHGCAAALSAYVLRKFDGGLKLVRVYRTFDKLGTFGAVGDISPIEIGGDDGIAIYSGGMFQGYSYGGVDFYAFHRGQLVKLDSGLAISDSDNSGAETDPNKALEITSKWFIDPANDTALVVDYKIAAHGGAPRIERLVWRLKGTSFVPQGRVPPELSAGAH